MSRKEKILEDFNIVVSEMLFKMKLNENLILRNLLFAMLYQKACIILKSSFPFLLRKSRYHSTTF